MDYNKTRSLAGSEAECLTARNVKTPSMYEGMAKNLMKKWPMKDANKFEYWYSRRLSRLNFDVSPNDKYVQALKWDKKVEKIFPIPEDHIAPIPPPPSTPITYEATVLREPAPSASSEVAAPLSAFKVEPETTDLAMDTHLELPPRQFVMTRGEKVVMTFTLPSDPDEYLLTLPLKYEEWKVLEKRYTDISPYFKTLFKDLERTHGTSLVLMAVNSYLRQSQFAKGTNDYYFDQCFGTRRIRDGFVAHLKAFSERNMYTAHAAAQEDNYEKEQNVTFNDQREVISDSGYIAGQIRSSGKSTTMDESEWHVRDLLSRPVLISNLSWATGDDVGKELLNICLPGQILKGMHATICSRFTFFRGHPRIRIQINGTKFHSGRLIAYFVPRYSNVKKDYITMALGNTPALPHVMLDASFSNSAVLELPFVHQNMYFNLKQTRKWQTLGNLFIRVFNPLKTATSTSQAIELSIWASFDNCELHQPSLVRDVALPVVAHMEALAMSKAGDAALNVAKNLVDGPLGDVVGGVLNADKPTDPIEINRWVPNAVTSLAYGDGMDKSQRLGLLPTGFTLPSAELISTTKDDMDLKEVMKIPCRIGYFDWESTDERGKKLFTFPVTPSYSDRLTQTDDYLYSPSLLAYCSRAFKFWRGSLKYKVQVVASQMHSGRIMINFAPTLTLKDATLIGMSNLNAYIVDLQEKAEVEFVVNFVCEKPWLRSDKFLSTEEDVEVNDSCLGELRCTVLNPLVAPDSVSASVSLNVYVSAGDDYEVACPSDLYCVNWIGPPPARVEKRVRSATPFIAHSLMTQDTVTTRTETANASLTRGGTTLPIAGDVTMGEDCMNLKTLLRRYELIATRTSNISKTWRFTYLQWQNSPNIAKVSREFSKVSSDPTAGMTARTHLAHFSELFTYWRGSLRYKFIFTAPNASNITVTAFHIPSIHANATFSFGNFDEPYRKWLENCTPLGVCVGSGNVQSSLEFEVPFYTPMVQLDVSSGANADWWFDGMNATGTVFLLIDNPNNDDFMLNYSLYQSAGDDFGLNYLRTSLMLSMNKEGSRTQSIDDHSPYQPQLPNPIYITKGLPTAMDKLHLSDSGEDTILLANETTTLDNYEAHGLSDRFKPTCFTKAERFLDTAQGMLDTTRQTISRALSTGEGPSTGTGTDDDGKGDDDDPDPLNPNNVKLVGGWLASTFQSLMDYLGNLTELIPGITLKGMTLPTLDFDLPGVVNALTSFISCKNLFTRACALYSILKLLLKDQITRFGEAGMTLVTGVLKSMYDRMKSNGRSLAHAEYIDFAGPLAAVLAIGTFVTTLARLPATKEITDMVRNISEKLRLFNFATSALTNLSKLYTAISDVVQYLIEWVVLKLDPNWLPRIAMIKDFDKIEDWAAFIDSLKGKDIADLVNYDLDMKNKILRCVDQANHYRTLLATAKIGREAKYIYDLTTTALEYGTIVREAKAALPLRVDPCCVTLHGPTGIGKSTLITGIAAEVMDRLDYPKHNRWCAFNPNEKFATENYTGQSAIYIDDIAAFNTPEQWQTFFNLKANTQHPLNMAFRKGTCFDSDFIFTTTNVPYPAPNCISHRPALLRRRNFLIEACYATLELSRKARRGENIIRDDNSHVVFRFCKPEQTGEFLSDWLSYDDLVDELTYLSRMYMQKQREVVNAGLERLHYTVAPVQSLPEVPNPLLLFADPQPPNPPPPQTPVVEDPFDTDEYNGVADMFEAHAGDDEKEEEKEEYLSVASDPDGVKCALCGIVHEIKKPDELFSDALVYYPSSQLAAGDSFFMVTSPELLEALTWNGNNFILPEDQTPEIVEEYRELVERAEKERAISGIPESWKGHVLTYHLMRISYNKFTRPLPNVPDDSPDSKTTLEMIKEKLLAFKQMLVDKVKKFMTDHPAIMSIMKTFVYGCAVGLAYVFLAAVTTRVAHVCSCSLMTWFGYRCGICGRWPKLGSDANHNAWLVKEWSRLFGNKPYVGGSVTTLDEENAIRHMRQESRIEKFTAGSTTAHAAYSSTDVSGQKVAKVFANSEIKANGLLSGTNQHVNTVRDIACRAMYTIQSPLRLGGLRMSGIAVGGRDLLVPNHFFTGCEKGDVWRVLHDGAWLAITYDEAKHRVIPNKDACLVELPVRFHAHKDLIKHFITESELAYVKKTACSLLKLGFDQRNYVYTGNCERMDELRYKLSQPDKDHSLRTVNVYRYSDIPVAPGECGSILLTHSSKVSGVILGFHIAGNAEAGISTLITREMLRGVSTGTQRLGTPVPEVTIAHCSNLIPPGHFGRVGTVDRKEMVVQSCKTQIIPTRIYEAITPHATEPSVLSQKDPRLEIPVSPLRKGISKYGTTAVAFDKAKLDLITDYINAKIDALPQIRKPGVLSVDEAILGFPGLEGYEPLPMNTSPGWPYVLTRPSGEAGKGYMFSEDRTEITDSLLSVKLRERTEMAKRGERVKSVWIDCLKDERRALQKIKTGSTRVFTIPPVDFSILMRQYTLDFCEAMKNGRRNFFSQVGINTQSLEWTELYKRLSKNSNLCIAGDYSSYDGTIPPELIERFFFHAYYYLTGTMDKDFDLETWNVLAVLCDESIHTVHLAKDQCYVTHKGNKSGSPVTVMLNSVVGMYYLCYAWLELGAKQADGLTLWKMDQLVEVAIYGDDNLFTVKAEAIEWFNQETISELLIQYGITYTNESKTGITKFKSLDEATFLKNGFGTWTGLPLIKVPLMAKQTITELLNWTRIAPDQDALLMDNINDALRFAYFYGPDYYNDLRSRIIEALKKNNMYEAVCPYSDFDYWFREACGMI